MEKSQLNTIRKRVGVGRGERKRAKGERGIKNKKRWI